MWRDRKRHLWPLGLVVPALTFGAIGGFEATGQAVWLWLGPIVILGIVPILDLVGGVDQSNPPEDLIEALERDRYYRIVTFAYLPLQYAGFILGMWVIARGGLSAMEAVGLAVTMGFAGGIGINTAHELGHKREEAERWLSKIALAQSGYGHFHVEHNRGHHVRVATPEDPASARMGESFWAFLPRTFIGSLRSSWELEAKRLRLRGRSPWRPGNDVLAAWSMTVVLWGVLLIWLGWSITPYLLLQAAVGIVLLEAVNYMEHYGLLRRTVMHGDRQRYERIDPSHSWNSNNIATNVLLYHLQRHSDHHANPTRRYQALRDTPDAPVLPTGYAGMILLALLPPVWRRVMDPRVIAHYGGDRSRANLTPRERSRSPLGDRVSPDPHVSSQESRGSVRTARCPSCGYTYDPARGAPREGFRPGTPWAAVPDDWPCPDCGVREKVDFEVLAGR